MRFFNEATFVISIVPLLDQRHLSLRQPTVRRRLPRFQSTLIRIASHSRIYRINDALVFVSRLRKRNSRTEAKS